MQPEYVSVGDLFARECVFLVPLFQRPYVWDEERWQLLWDDIVRVGQETLYGQTPRRHFLGSIVVQQRPAGVIQIPRREVIDGQQRLTTLQIVLKSAVDVLGSDIVTEAAAQPLVALLRHAHAAKSDVEGSYKVWPTNADRLRFRNVMDGAVSTTSLPDDKFGQAYSFFKNKVSEWLACDGTDPETREKRGDALARSLRQHLWLIALNLAEDDQAQIIFETLNARGTPLTPADLIKNILLRRAQDENASLPVLYEKYWKGFDEDEFWHQNVGAGYTARKRVDFFLQQALTVFTGEVVPLSEVYDKFVSYLLKTKTVVSATEHMQKIHELSGIAKRVFLAREDDPSRALVAAARIQDMEFATALPVLLILLAAPSRNPEDVSKTAIWLESFLVRRMVCGLNTGMYGLLFVDIMKAVATTQCACDGIAALLLRETSGSARWPDDREFGEAWRSVPLYKTLRRRRLNMIMRALESSLRHPELTDPVPIPSKLHIEHVMPQSWKQWWPLPANADQDGATSRDRIVHTVGNLTLLQQKLNERLSNAPWKTGNGDSKRAALQQHGLMRLNSMLVVHENWDEKAILARSDELLEHAIRIWPRPKP